MKDSVFINKLPIVLLIDSPCRFPILKLFQKLFLFFPAVSDTCKDTATNALNTKKEFSPGKIYSSVDSTDKKATYRMHCT